MIEFIEKHRSILEQHGLLAFEMGTDQLPADVSVLTSTQIKFKARMQPTGTLFRREAKLKLGYMQCMKSLNPQAMKRYAEAVEELHFPGVDRVSVLQCEEEYWRIVRHGLDIGTTLYGQDLDLDLPEGSTLRPSFKSLTTALQERLSRAPGTPLKALHSIPGVNMCRSYYGSPFASFCWHVEDHALYSFNWMALGKEKVWYTIPPSQSGKFEEIFCQLMPDLVSQDPEVLHAMVTQIPPDMLIAHGLTVNRYVQGPRVMVVTAADAYHCGFSTGFNCALSSNFSLPCWIPVGYKRVQQYHTWAPPRTATFSQDAVLLQLLKDAGAGLWPGSEMARASVRYAADVLEAKLRHKQEKEDKEGKLAAKEVRMLPWQFNMNTDVPEGEEEWPMTASTSGGADEEDVGDEEAGPIYDCDVCKCDLYLWALVPPGSGRPQRALCIDHKDQLDGANWVLMYRHTDEELIDIIQGARRAAAGTVME